MGKCKGECEFCKDHFKRPETKKPIKNYKDYRNGSKDTVNVDVRIPKETYTKLEILCKLDDRKMNNLIVTMILNEFEDINYEFNKHIKNEN